MSIGDSHLGVADVLTHLSPMSWFQTPSPPLTRLASAHVRANFASEYARARRIQPASSLASSLGVAPRESLRSTTTAVEAVPAGATTFTLARLDLIGMVTGALDPAAALGDGTVVVDGDVGVLARLVGVLAEPDPDFDIVVP